MAFAVTSVLARKCPVLPIVMMSMPNTVRKLVDYLKGRVGGSRASQTVPVDDLLDFRRNAHWLSGKTPKQVEKIAVLKPGGKPRSWVLEVKRGLGGCCVNTLRKGMRQDVTSGGILEGAITGHYPTGAWGAQSMGSRVSSGRRPG